MEKTFSFFPSSFLLIPAMAGYAVVGGVKGKDIVSNSVLIPIYNLVFFFKPVDRYQKINTKGIDDLKR